MKPNHSYEIPMAIAAVVGISIAAVGFYPVRELVAALAIFSILFGTVGMALLILFLIQEVAEKGVTHLEARLARVRARHSAASARPLNDHMLRTQRWN